MTIEELDDEDAVPEKKQEKKRKEAPASIAKKEAPPTKKQVVEEKKPKEQKEQKKEKPAAAPAAAAPEAPAGAKKREFKNGMEIVNISMGKPNGAVAKSGKKVTMKYVGKLQSGKIFDQTRGNATFSFRLGVGEVIKGWDVGVEGMRVGDKRRLTIPPAMAYGKKGVKGAIPGNATLIFDVELVNA